MCVCGVLFSGYADAMQSVTPYLLYEDVAAAVEWLSGAFGFREEIHYLDEKGVVYAELAFGLERLMVARFAEGYRSARHVGYHNGQVYLTVDDVDAHFARAKAAGATILAEPHDKPYGLRMYIADDPEGQRWMIAQQVRDVLPEEWGGETVHAGGGRTTAVSDESPPFAS